MAACHPSSKSTYVQALFCTSLSSDRDELKTILEMLGANDLTFWRKPIVGPTLEQSERAYICLFIKFFGLRTLRVNLGPEMHDVCARELTRALPLAAIMRRGG